MYTVLITMLKSMQAHGCRYSYDFSAAVLPRSRTAFYRCLLGDRRCSWSCRPRGLSCGLFDHASDGGTFVSHFKRSRADDGTTLYTDVHLQHTSKTELKDGVKPGTQGFTQSWSQTMTRSHLGGLACGLNHCFRSHFWSPRLSTNFRRSDHHDQMPGMGYKNRFCSCMPSHSSLPCRHHARKDGPLCSCRYSALFLCRTGWLVVSDATPLVPMARGRSCLLQS